MNARRFRSLIAVTTLAVAGVFVVAPAQVAVAAGPALSAYCQTLHDNAGTVSTTGTLSLNGVVNAGEQVAINTSGPTGLSLHWHVVAPTFTSDFDQGMPAGTLVFIDGNGVLTIQISHAGGASVSFDIDCGRPPTVTISPAGGTYHYGDVVPVTFECDGQTSAAVACSDTYGVHGTPAGDPAGFNLIGHSFLDTSHVGAFQYHIATNDGTFIGIGGATVDFTVLKAPQTITLSTAPVSVQVGGPAYAVSATASTGLPVTISIDAASAAVCALSGGSVTFTATGTCKINASQAGNANYSSATASQSITVVRAGTKLVAARATVPLLGLLPSRFSATLTRLDNGAPVVGAVIVFVVPGGSIGCTATTNTSGIASCTRAVGTFNKFFTHSYTATYLGNAIYLGSAATAQLG